MMMIMKLFLFRLGILSYYKGAKRNSRFGFSPTDAILECELPPATTTDQKSFGTMDSVGGQVPKKPARLVFGGICFSFLLSCTSHLT
jgi:hypothetical protein